MQVARDVDGECRDERRGHDRDGSPEEDRRAKERMAQDEFDALADLDEQVLARPVDRGVEVAPDKGEREGRHGKRHGVDRQRRPGPMTDERIPAMAGPMMYPIE